MLFFYLGFGWPVVYGDNPGKGNFLIEAAINGCIPGPTRLFAINFIIQIEEEYFTEELVMKYFQSFNFQDGVDESWTLMRRFILKFAKILDENSMVSLVQTIHYHLASLIS